jgi:phosphate transport system substrate-binding protein
MRYFGRRNFSLMLVVALALAATFALATQAAAETCGRVRLTDGETLSGLMVAEDSASITMLIGNRRVRYDRARLAGPVEDVPCAGSAVPPPVPVMKLNTVQTLRLYGSDSIGGKLAPALGRAFGQDKGMRIEEPIVPDDHHHIVALSDATRQVTIDINSPGTCMFPSRVVDGGADIGMASDQVKLPGQGFCRDVVPADVIGQFFDSDRKLKDGAEHVIALDGVRVLVNGQNQFVKILNLDQLGRVYSGYARLWSDLISGWPHERINIYSLNAESGTRKIFERKVLAGQHQVGAVRESAEHREVADWVAHDRNGIGYVAFGERNTSAKNVILETRCRFADPGVEVVITRQYRPDDFMISTEEYPLSRRLYFYTKVPYPNDLTREFVEFVLRNDGQEAVSAAEFVDLRPKISSGSYTSERQSDLDAVREQAVWTAAERNAAENFRGHINGSLRLSITFRFANDIAALDSRAGRDVGRLAQWWRQQPAPRPRLLLVGHTSFVGGADYNLGLSLRRAEAVAAKVQQALPGTEDRIPIETLSVGRVNPVACEPTALDDLNLNRRVEVWMLPGAR